MFRSRAVCWAQPGTCALKSAVVQEWGYLGIAIWQTLQALAQRAVPCWRVRCTVLTPDGARGVGYIL